MHLTPDADVHNADWIKTLSWDLPTDPNEFMQFLTANGTTLEHFLTLPSAEAMPPALTAALVHTQAHKGLVGMETKTRHVRDPEYWHLPYGTPLVAGQRPPRAGQTGTIDAVPRKKTKGKHLSIQTYRGRADTFEEHHIALRHVAVQTLEHLKGTNAADAWKSHLKEKFPDAKGHARDLLGHDIQSDDDLDKALKRLQYVKNYYLLQQTDDWRAHRIKDVVAQMKGKGGKHPLSTKELDKIFAEADDIPWDEIYVAKFVSKYSEGWCLSSADSQPSSLALQKVIHDELAPQSTTDHLSLDNPKVDAVLNSHEGTFLLAFVHAVYETTQEDLHKRGVKYVSAYRGARWGNGNIRNNELNLEVPPDDLVHVAENYVSENTVSMPYVDMMNKTFAPYEIGKMIGSLKKMKRSKKEKRAEVRKRLVSRMDARNGGSQITEGEVEIPLQPVSSFATMKSAAEDFSFDGSRGYFTTLSHASIPAEDVWSTAIIGMGEISQGEVLVLGGSYQMRTKFGLPHASYDMDAVRNAINDPSRDKELDDAIEMFTARIKQDNPWWLE